MNLKAPIKDWYLEIAGQMWGLQCMLNKLSDCFQHIILVYEG